jgi:hypothetical protein
MDGGSESQTPPKRQSRGPVAEADPNVSIDVSVGLISSRILVTNRTTDTLENVLIVISAGEEEFRHSFGTLHSEAMIHFAPSVFRRADGTILDPAEHRIKTFTVYADGSRGRGRWHGSY